MIKQILLIIFIITLGCSAALALNSENYQLARQTYIQKCSGCHIPIAVEVLPTESWQKILENPDKHYGVRLPEMTRIETILLWEYLRNVSRAFDSGEPIPTFVQQSRYFRALHPKVELPENITHQTCVTCHIKASEFDYQTLAPEWQN